MLWSLLTTAWLCLAPAASLQLRAAAPTLILTQTLCAVCAPSLGDLGDIAATCRELESVLGPVSGEAAGEAAVPRVLSLQPNNLVKRLHLPVEFCPTRQMVFTAAPWAVGRVIHPFSAVEPVTVFAQRR